MAELFTIYFMVVNFPFLGVVWILEKLKVEVNPSMAAFGMVFPFVWAFFILPGVLTLWFISRSL